LENRVEELRKSKGLSQEEFAKMIRVSRQTVSSIETGKYNPSLQLAFAIAKCFDMSIEGIFLWRDGVGNEEK
jgi:putative transcriptional regulator